MKRSDEYLFLLAAQREFEWLCKKIIHDGRDPYIVACEMTAQLSKYMRQMRELWEGSKHEKIRKSTRRQHTLEVQLA
jgi:hypothetical protein